MHRRRGYVLVEFISTTVLLSVANTDLVMETATQGLGLGIHAMTHRPALHEDNRMVPILAATVADSPNTYFALGRRATNSKLKADR